MRALALLLVCQLLLGCVSQTQQVEEVPLGRGQYQLQPIPSHLQGQGRLEQLLVTRDNQQHQLLLQIELHARQIKMVGFSAAGLTLFELNWQPFGMIQSHNYVPIDGVPVTQILAYFQLANWPLESLNSGLQGIELNASNNGQTRQFTYHGQAEFSVVKTAQKSVFTHQQQHFTIEINTLKIWPINE